MTTKDTYDIEEANQKTTNIQPSLLIKLMKESEPCLFNNKSEPAVSPVEKPIDVTTLLSSPYGHPYVPPYSSFPKMVEITRWHANEQVRYFRELL